MPRRTLFKFITGLFAAKSLPVAPVKVPASLRVAKAAAATSPVFAGDYLELHGIGLMEWMRKYEEAKAEKAIAALPASQRSDCVAVHNMSAGAYKAMTREDYTVERRQIDLFGPTPSTFA